MSASVAPSFMGAHSFGVGTSWRPGQMISSPGTRGFSTQTPAITHDGRCSLLALNICRSFLNVTIALQGMT